MTDDTRQPTEEELRAAYEAEIKQIRIEQIVLENIVTLVNMGMRKTGLIPGTEDERDPAQVQVAIEGVRAHLPLIAVIAPDQSGPIQDALSQLQMAFVQIGGPAEGQPSATQPSPGQPAVATSPLVQPGAQPAAPAPPPEKSRLWIPGQ